MEALLKTNIERFSLKKFNEYKNNGTPVRLCTGGGTEVHIIAYHIGVEKKQFMVESVVLTSPYRDKPYVEWWAINPSGTSVYNKDYRGNVYVHSGAIDIEPGDVFLYGYRPDDSFYFMAVFDHITCLDGKGMPGICMRWSMDLYGHQFCQAGTFHDLDGSINDRPFYMRKATDQEHDQYWAFIEANGLRLSKDGTRLVCYPKVGQPYWTIEMQDGKPIVKEQAAPATEQDRPFEHDLCFTRKETAETYAKNMVDKIFG